MAERLHSDLPEGTVLLNKAVRTIQWQGSFREEGDDARVFPVRVECEDGDAFLADHVIITVPLGEDTDTSPCPARPLRPAGRGGHGQVEGRDSHWEEVGQGFGEVRAPQTPFRSLAASCPKFVAAGFLKEHYEKFFQPPLPERKAQAIRNLGFGTNNKIFLEFEQPFWDPEQQLLEVVWEDESPLEEPSTDLEANWFKKLIGFVVLQPPEQ